MESQKAKHDDVVQNLRNQSRTELRQLQLAIVELRERLEATRGR
jgi:hypothetical protein